MLRYLLTHFRFSSEEMQSSQNMRNRFVPLSEGVTVCAAHPLNGTIIAGTKKASLLMVSQKRQSFYGKNYRVKTEEDQ
ncbi:hypothetical protein GIB67_040192 [Kingdonia uniflora]|uniref:Uncharacterized protein n=1 Tax=Kingdonia uniflora TaxID=39325 RepID=A0A7J7MVF8_9MAGN|nr:hypothetical protein GIB67_040192 [Kingdonia uniflora]